MRFYGEGDPVGVSSQRHLHFVDVERKEARRLLALETPPSVRIKTTVLLELVRTSPVERLLAATDETRLDLIWNYTSHARHICQTAKMDRNSDVRGENAQSP